MFVNFFRTKRISCYTICSKRDVTTFMKRYGIVTSMEFSGNYNKPVSLTLNHEVTIVEFSNMSIKLISKWDWSDRRAIRLVYDVIISSQFRVKLFAWFHFLISRTLVSASLIEICILKSLSCILRIFF